MSVQTSFIKSAVIPKSEEMTKAFIMKKEPRRALRVRRELYDAKKQTMETGIGTKSQQALKLQQEQNKLARKERSKKEREEESDRLFEMKQQKKKEKHRGH